MKTVLMLVEAFKKKYSTMQVEGYQESTWKLYERFVSEQKAGKYLCDVMILTGAPVMSRLKKEGYLVPFNDTEMKNYPTSAIDPEGYWISMSSGPMFLGVNKKLPKELWPKDYKDFLNPRPEWKGVSIYDPRVGTSPYTLVYQLWKVYGENWSRAFWQSIASLRPTFYTGTAPLTQALAAGETLVTLCMMPYQYGLFVVEQGANLEIIIPESGVSWTPDMHMGLIKSAQNPNAAKLFIHWILSKEGQGIYLADYRTSSRLDMEPPKGLPDIRKLKLFPIDELEADRVREELLKKWESWMGL